MMTMDERIAEARKALIAQVDLNAVHLIDAYVRLVHVSSCKNKHRVDDGAGHTESEYCGTNDWYCAEMPPTDGHQTTDGRQTTEHHPPRCVNSKTGFLRDHHEFVLWKGPGLVKVLDKCFDCGTKNVQVSHPAAEART